jgi:hypothetical protein
MWPAKPVSLLVLWIRIRKDQKLFAGQASVSVPELDLNINKKHQKTSDLIV